jgi:hypothetical protein
MSLFFDNCRLIEPAGVQLFLFLGCNPKNETAAVGAVEKVGIPPSLRDFQAPWESLAFGLFHEASFSIALLPTDTAIEPNSCSKDIEQHVSSPATEFRNDGIEGIRMEAVVRFTRREDAREACESCRSYGF